ncbi:MAG: DUF1853 family protein [Bacteroidota bacterium]
MNNTEKITKQFHSFLETPSLFLNNNSPIEVENFLTKKETLFTLSETTEKQVSRHKFLGKRVEFFFADYIQQHPNYNLLAHSLQVFEDQKTLGEFDFFIQDKEKKVIKHIELIYKLYIYDGSYSENDLACWVGPNRKDFLVDKIHKLKTKQFPLIKSQQAKTILEEKLDLSVERIQQEVCFKAMLFTPHHSNEIDNLTFEHINPECITGEWFLYSSYLEILQAEDRFYIPKKTEWICLPHLDENYFDYKEFRSELAELKKTGRAVMVWRFSMEQLSRDFVLFK